MMIENVRSDRPGELCQGLWYLGRPESGIYWLEGSERALLISGGMSYIVPSVVEQMERFGLNGDRLTGILILHCHFDHVGVVPYFKRRYPDVTVYASKRAWEILGRDKTIDTINAFSKVVAARMEMADALASFESDWFPELTGVGVSEGDRISLGDREVMIIETPGHSSCSISGYVPQIKALFPSDGGGVPFGDTIISCGNSNYTQYQDSLARLKDLDVDYLCADHYGYLCGEEAARFVKRSIEIAAVERAQMEEVYLRTKDIDAAAHEIAAAFLQKNPDYFLSEEIYTGVMRQVIRHLASCIDGPRQSEA